MSAEPLFLAADWGTTSFRLWSLAADGTVLSETSSGQGMTSLAPSEYETVLEEAIQTVGGGSATPVIICGMAGAAQGWREATYINLPAPLADVPGLAVTVPTSSGRDVRILPGLAQRSTQSPDVMRGEETLLLGAVLGGGGDGLYCLPGTHSKWVRVKGGSVTHFATAMTGEVFSLLSQQSTLSHFATSSRSSYADLPAFEAGVRDGLTSPNALLHTLFSVRAGGLLFKDCTSDDATARLSGLLIGAEIAGRAAAETADQADSVTLIANEVLGQTYETALAIAGIPTRTVSAANLARVGLFHAAKLIWA
jgi:2-dehydro-3-deoxygalactonokinase